MIGIPPDEVSIDLLMSCLSIFVTQATLGISAEKLDQLRSALAEGRNLIIGIQVGPSGLVMSGNTDDEQGQVQPFLALTDNRDRWISWAADLVGRPELSPDK